MRSLTIRDGGGGLKIELYDSEYQLIRVLVENAEAVELNINEPYQLTHNSNRIQFEFPSGKRDLYALSRLIRFEEGHFVKITPLYNLNPVQVGWGSGENRIDKSFRGAFRIQRTSIRGDHRKEWGLINEIPMEQYLQSVVPKEMPPNYHVEALRAQVVLAGTYAAYHALDANILNREWDLDPTTGFQAYVGTESEHERTNEAIADAFGTILLHNNQVIEAEYHACVRNTTVGTSSNPALKAKALPSRIACRQYEETGGGHGRGMGQVAANHLASDGWANDRNAPTEKALLPQNIAAPWSYEDLLQYFYDAEIRNILQARD